MAIPESQLDTWSGLGSVQQSAQTYETIRNVLNDSTSPYYAKAFSIFLQGSYGNNTNVRRDSDVDIVICLTQTYYADTEALGQGAKCNYDNAFSPAPYAYDDFKADVLAWLTKQFGTAVKPGKKAIFVQGDGTRRDADVLVCTQHRRYWSSSTGVDLQYHEGISFWSDGVQIINFPKQHSENCTTKHQGTYNRFKPLVRVYKNMRNRMIEHGYIDEGIAPSYFIEGLLWNVPGNQFVASYGDSFVNTFNWVLNADKTNLTCANGLYKLIFDNSSTCWPAANFDAYLAAAATYWKEWG